MTQSQTDNIQANDLRNLDRDKVLAHTIQLIRKTWLSFDQARPTQPGVGDTTSSLLAMPLPEQGINAIRALLETENILDQSLSQSRPRYFAFVGSSGLEMGVLADALAACHDVNLAVYSGAANLVEQQSLRWIAELIKYPGQKGAFTSGGMVSNLTALTAAREQALPGSRVDGMRQPAALYLSRDAHASIERAASILGLGSRALRDVPLDAQRRMDVRQLEGMIKADIRAGVRPVAIIASAGTTLSGAIDPFEAIAEIAERYQIWFHIDGAYGGPAAAVASVTDHFRGLAQAHSISIDAHKWLFLPKPCGVLLVRDQAALIAAFAHDATYIPDESEMIHPVNWTLEYSRPLRALKVWLALRTYGAAAFREAIERNLAQARLCAVLIRKSPHLELLLEPQLSVVLFRHRPAKGDLNAHNRRLGKALQEDGRIYVAGAGVDGQDCLRACFVNYRTEADDVQVLIEVVEEIGAALNLPNLVPKL